MKDDLGGSLAENRPGARVAQQLLHVTHRLAHAFLAKDLENRRHPHGRNEADDGHDDHDFNQRERAGAAAAASSP